MVTRRVIQTEKTLPGTHEEVEVECPNDSAELLSFSIIYWATLDKDSRIAGERAHYTTVTAKWVIKNWA